MIYKLKILWSCLKKRIKSLYLDLKLDYLKYINQIAIGNNCILYDHKEELHFDSDFLL